MAHIALFIPDLNVGGAERVFVTLANSFCSAGHRVDLLLGRAHGPLLHEVPHNVNIVELSAPRFHIGIIGFAASTTLGLIRYLRRERPDVVLSTLTGANLSASLAFCICATKARLILREACSIRNIQSPIRIHLMRLLYRRASLIIALTTQIQDELRQIVSARLPRIEVIPNPIDMEAIKIKSLHPLSHPWITESAAPLVCSIGRLVPQKDFKTLISAFKIVRHSSNARLVILGDGPGRTDLQQQIRSLGLEDSVALLGSVSNPYQWLVRSKIFVTSSLWEGYPNALLEAVAFKLPVVSSEYDPSVRALLKNHPTHFIFPTGNVPLLAESITQALNCDRPRHECLPDDVRFAAKKYLDVMLSTR